MTTRPVLHIDRCLGGVLLSRELKAAGWSAEVHDDHFAHDAVDTEWLPVVAARGWVILTKDEQIGHKPGEVAAVAQHGARMIVMVSAANQRGIAAAIMKGEEAICKICASEPAPFILKLYASGEVVVWRSAVDLVR